MKSKKVPRKTELSSFLVFNSMGPWTLICVLLYFVLYCRQLLLSFTNIMRYFIRRVRLFVFLEEFNSIGNHMKDILKSMSCFKCTFFKYKNHALIFQ